MSQKAPRLPNFNRKQTNSKLYTIQGKGTGFSDSYEDFKAQISLKWHAEKALEKSKLRQ
jgi:hypothetical protein